MSAQLFTRVPGSRSIMITSNVCFNEFVIISFLSYSFIGDSVCISVVTLRICTLQNFKFSKLRMDLLCIFIVTLRYLIFRNEITIPHKMVTPGQRQAEIDKRAARQEPIEVPG